MWCPECRSEYVDGIEHCPVCRVDLVADEPGAPKTIDLPDYLRGRRPEEVFATVDTFASEEEAETARERLATAEVNGLLHTVTSEEGVSRSLLLVAPTDVRRAREALGTVQHVPVREYGDQAEAERAVAVLAQAGIGARLETLATDELPDEIGDALLPYCVSTPAADAERAEELLLNADIASDAACGECGALNEADSPWCVACGADRT